MSGVAFRSRWTSQCAGSRRSVYARSFLDRRGLKSGQAFHPSAPLVATCGSDRLVAIWHVPRLDGGEDETKLAIVELPIWISMHLATDWVTTIIWLNKETLLTSSRASTQVDAVARTDTHPGFNLEDYEVSIVQPAILRQLFAGNGLTIKEDDLMVGEMSDLAFHTLDEVQVRSGRSGWTPSLAVWDGGPWLLAPAGSGIRVMDLRSLDHANEVTGPTDDARSVRAVAAGGRYCACVGEEGLLRVHSIAVA